MTLARYFTLVFCLACGLTAKIPSEFSTCKLNSDNFDSCLKNSINGAIKVLANNGLPKFGIPKCDPIIIPQMTIGAGSMAVNLQQNYKDVYTYGYSKANVTNAHLDLAGKKLRFNVKIPQLIMDMKYTVDGRILLIPVRGEGNAKFYLDDCDIIHNIGFDIIKKKEKNFINVKNYDIKVKTKKAQFKFENLFNGNQELSDSVHRVVNQNWEVVYEDVSAGYEQAFNSLFILYAKSFFGKVPMDVVFPQ